MNQAGRIMDLTRQEFDKMTANGVRLQIIERELREIPETESIIYTAICGKYPIERDDIYCFTGEGMFQEPVMEAKRYKILPHKFFPEAEFTIWVDGNIYPKMQKDYMVAQLLGEADIAIFRHGFRENVYQEFEELRHDPRFHIPYLQDKMAEQEARYKKEGLPPVQLYECNFMIRRNNSRVNDLMDKWWVEICRYSWRDQLSFPYVFWKYGKGVKLRVLDGNIRQHKLFKHIETYGI